jgi:Response regulator containing a CheY-like receiver domain and an HTH DNA-binding domain
VLAIFIVERQIGMENAQVPSHYTSNLSKRELDVFELLLKGLSNKKIASSFQISPKTVEEHLTSIYSKLGVESRSEAILWGIARARDFPH